MTDAPYTLKTIAHIHTAFPTKFGIPRQSGLAPSLLAQIIFEPDYQNPDAVRGLEGFSHLWLIWQFSECLRPTWSPTVRPPRLGGNQRMGVFATRSPFRPNALGLSSVKLEKIDFSAPHGPVLYVSGADLMDQTPIFDIKPFLPFTDNHPDAAGGFADKAKDHALRVQFPTDLLQQIPAVHHAALQEILAQDPRPSYQNDPERIYGFRFAGWEIRFQVQKDLLTVVEAVPAPHPAV